MKLANLAKLLALGLVLTFAVLAFNMVGDSLRDIFDPRQYIGE